MTPNWLVSELAAAAAGWVVDHAVGLAAAAVPVLAARAVPGDLGSGQGPYFPNAPVNSSFRNVFLAHTFCR